MKKIILSFLVMLVFTGFSFAQNGKVTKTTVAKTAHAKAVKPAPSLEMKTTVAAPVNKDGSPDKRYIANKMLKKNGTPDKRYKANKKS